MTSTDSMKRALTAVVRRVAGASFAGVVAVLVVATNGCGGEDVQAPVAPPPVAANPAAPLSSTATIPSSTTSSVPLSPSSTVTASNTSTTIPVSGPTRTANGDIIVQGSGRIEQTNASTVNSDGSRR